MPLYPDQDKAVTQIYETGEVFLYGEMGSGKTLTALNAMAELIRDNVVSRVLVCAPKRVCEQVWIQDNAKHSVGLNVVCAAGLSPAQRLDAIQDTQNQVILLNFENLKWAKDNKLFSLFNMLVVDESTKLKGGGQAFKALRSSIGVFDVRLVLTGTPIAESWQDIFYQMMLVDNGAAFGRNKQKFLATFFESDFMGYNWTLKEGADKVIYERIRSRFVALPSYTESLPELSETIERVKLPDDALNTYEILKHDMSLDDVTAVNAAVLVGKLQQASCGFLYLDDSDDSLFLHNEKMARLNAILKAGIKTVVFYQFKEELNRLTCTLDKSALTTDISAFKRASGPQVLAIHPKSAGHGVDLTCASRVVFLSAVWSRDLMRQSIARVWRRGQPRPVDVFILVGMGTIEDSIVAREQSKGDYHALLLRHIATHKHQQK